MSIMSGARQLAIALLLQSRGSLTVRELGRMLRVSQRTVARDRVELSATGIPLLATRGPGGGYALPPNTRIDLGYFVRRQLEEQEGAGGLPAGQEAATAAGDAAARGLEQLRLALRQVAKDLPDEYRDAFEAAAAALVAGSHAGMRVEGEPRHLATVRLALWAGRRMRIRYPTSRASARERTIDPYVLVCTNDRWYLMAHCDWRDEVHTFEVARIHEATLLDQPVRAPDVVQIRRG
jgi:predicted DNA-binding transcriptional regulator YafY